MIRTVYRFTFEKSADVADIEDAVVLARAAAEGAHGEVDVCLDACYALSPNRRTFVVDATDAIGRTIARAFAAVLLRTVGYEAFEVERLLVEATVRRPTPRSGARR